MAKRRFELVEGRSSKFWEVSVDGASFTVTFGRIGTSGQSKTKACKSSAAAKAEVEKLVAEKTRKGYAQAAAKKSAARVTKKPARAKFQQIVSEYGSAFIGSAIEDAELWDGDWQKWENAEHWKSEYGGVVVQRRGKAKNLALEMDLFTAWIPAQNGGVFVRGGAHFASEKAAQAIATAVPAKTWKRLRSKLDLPSGTFVVFDAGVSGSADLKRLRADSEGGVITAQLASGSYTLSVAEHDGYDLVRLAPS
ncbi:MAG: WGR domain-containing protein [Deltaproteobacteria bacterium]|nr:WGR domain-containing protein [Deltaproteobacteria bacterium]